MSHLNVIVGDETFERWGSKTILSSEAIGIERAYGKTFKQFTADVDDGSEYARQVLAWSLLRRHDPGLKVGEVDLPIGDIRLELVCDICDRKLTAKVQDDEVDGVTIRTLVLRDGLVVRIHEDDETDECSDAEVIDDPFKLGSPAAAPDSSRSGGPGTSLTSQTSSPSAPGSGID